MEFAISPALGKSAAQFAVKGGAKLFKPRWTRWRMSRQVSKKAKDQGVSVTAAGLRQWMKSEDGKEQLQFGAAQDVESAVRRLAHIVSGGTPQQRWDNAQKVLEILFSAYLRAQETNEAIGLSHEWLNEQVQQTGEATRAGVVADLSPIIEAPRSFEVYLERLHPWWRDRATSVHAHWSPIAGVLQAISAASSSGDLLQQWAEFPPEWAQSAPADAMALLGELALSQSRHHAAETFFGYAVDLGIEVRGYWLARQATAASHRDPNAARAVIDLASDDHPLALAVVGILDGDPRLALTHLDVWSPQNERDISLRLILMAQCRGDDGQVNEAVHLAMEAAANINASEAAEFAVNRLLSRARGTKSIHRQADIEAAMGLALRARSQRRAWKEDSVEAAESVVFARVMAGDVTGARRASLAEPRGEATVEEAADARLRGWAARLAAMDGCYNEARDAAAGLDDPFVLKEIEARELGADGAGEASLAAWVDAYDLALVDSDRHTAAWEIALLGGPLPDLSKMAPEFGESIEEIRLVQRAFSAREDRLEVMRELAPQSLLVTVELANVYVNAVDYNSAAGVLEDGGRRWRDPRLMLMAARRFQQAGQHREAIQSAETALALGADALAGRLDAYPILIECYSNLGEWDNAIARARALVTLQPDNESAIWALAQCLLARGNTGDAWAALTLRGQPISPRRNDQARDWVALYAMYGDPQGFLGKALDAYLPWADDEEVAGFFLGQMSVGLARSDVPPSEQDGRRFQEAISAYTERFPDTRVFKALAFDPEHPLDGIGDLLRERHERVEPLAAPAIEGKIPLGCLADALGSSYLEVTIRRARGMVLCEQATQGEDSNGVVETSLNHAVVLDTTAAHTLTLLDLKLRRLLLGGFATVMTTDRSYTDALVAEQSLGRRSTLSLVWDPVAQEAKPVGVTDDVAQELAESASEIRHLLGNTSRRPWLRKSVLLDLEGDSAWMANLDMAIAEGAPLWCDDLSLRMLAEYYGARAFSTVGLLRQLLCAGKIAAEELRVAEAVLIKNYYVDLGFDRAIFEFAATMDGWKPCGAAVAITRPQAWVDSEAVLGFGLHAVAQCVSHDLHAVQGWFEAVALGLVRIADTAEGVANNLGVLLGRAIDAPWFRPEVLPLVLAAIRRALEERNDAVDPLERVLARDYARWAEESSFSEAKRRLMELMAFTQGSDQDLAARVVLTASKVQFFVPGRLRGA